MPRVFPQGLGSLLPTHNPTLLMLSSPTYLESLSDNDTATELALEEAEDLRDAKQGHPYMGRMAFPDDLDRPARTVVATQLGRETLVLRSAGGFRRATIRECATIQSFPVTYQFIGNSVGSRYRQAGDAVAPMLAYSIAKQITGITHIKAREVHEFFCTLIRTIDIEGKRLAIFSVPKKFNRFQILGELRECGGDGSGLPSAIFPLS